VLSCTTLHINGRAAGLRAAVATSFHERLRGLLLRETWLSFDVLCLRPCSAVHSFGLRGEFDLVFTDVEGRIVRTVVALRPARIAHAPTAYMACELRPGLAVLLGLRCGDQLEASPCT
jgi:uncharacterized membrane protein (UPF0127 family)